MDTVFMNSKNRKTSDSHRLLLNRSDKIDLIRNEKKNHLVYMEKYKKVTQKQ